jgi:uncharacterized protein (TIGR02588 family)
MTRQIIRLFDILSRVAVTAAAVALLRATPSRAEAARTERDSHAAQEPDDPPDDEQTDTGPDQDRRRTPAERLSLALCISILLALVGLIAQQAVQARHRGPASVAAVAELERVRAEAGRYYLPVEIRNAGGEVATDVRVVLTLGDDGARRETSELLVDVLAGGASARGVAIFRRDPRQAPFEVEVVSYLEP